MTAPCHPDCTVEIYSRDTAGLSHCFCVAGEPNFLERFNGHNSKDLHLGPWGPGPHSGDLQQLGGRIP